MSFIVHFQHYLGQNSLIQKMKIICAGFPKTGSKSCSAALRVLGFKVADWLETAEYLGDTWIVGIPRKKCWAESSSMIIWESLKDRLFGREN